MKPTHAIAILALLLIASSASAGTLVWKNVPDSISGEPQVKYTTADGKVLDVYVDDIGFYWDPVGLIQRESPTVELQVHINGQIMDCDPAWWTFTDELQVNRIGQISTCTSAQRPEAQDFTMQMTEYDLAKQTVDLKITSKLLPEGSEFFADASNNYTCALNDQTRACEGAAPITPTPGTPPTATPPTTTPPGTTPSSTLPPLSVIFDTGYPSIDFKAASWAVEYAQSDCVTVLSRAASIENGAGVLDDTGRSQNVSASDLLESFGSVMGGTPTPESIQQAVRRGESNGVSANLVRGMAAKESSWKVYALNTGSGNEESLGLMQINAKDPAQHFSTIEHSYIRENRGVSITGDDRYNPKHNISLGVDILSEFLKYPSMQACKAKNPKSVEALAIYAYRHGNIPGDCQIGGEDIEITAKALAWKRLFEQYYDTIAPIFQLPQPNQSWMKSN